MKPLAWTQTRRSLDAARDDNGVVHIHAPTWLDALYGLGYAHATDRPTQLLFGRCVAAGRTAEKIADKPELIETDRFFRRAGLSRNLAVEARRLPSELDHQLSAYCSGVNDGLRQIGRTLPMWATGYQPEPWDIEAVMLIGNLLSYGGLVVTQQSNERLIVELIHSGVRQELLQELLDPLLDDCDFELLKRIKIANRLSDHALELIADLPRLAGSNAWAVAPQRSATGHALLSGDPHLEVNRLPAIWYEAVLSWPGQSVLGATLPGCPLFAVARTKQLAWSVTYFKADTSDSFIEDVRLGEQAAWQYRRGDEWRDFNVRDEVILRKDAPAESVRVYQSDVGTLETDPHDIGPGLHLASAWSGTAEGAGRSLHTFLGLIECRTARAAMDWVRHCPQPSLSWVFADRDGHIGWQTNGWIPRRREGISGLLPIPAWDRANHWQGWLDVDSLPSEYDPPRGYVATANETPEVDNHAQLVSQPLSSYRRRRINERLDALPQATLADMQALQYDVVSTQARDLLTLWLPMLDDGPLKQTLLNWDYSYAPERVEPTLFAYLYRNVLLSVFGQDTGMHGGLGWRRLVYLTSRVGFSTMIVSCVDRTLQRERSLWWQGRDLHELVRSAAAQVNMQDTPSWAEFNQFRFTNRFIESRWFGSALGIQTRPLPMRGCHATPFQGHVITAGRRETTFAPSYHFVTDLGTVEAWTNLPGGSCESWLSRWYKNDIALWMHGQYKSLSPRELHMPR